MALYETGVEKICDFQPITRHRLSQKRCKIGGEGSVLLIITSRKYANAVLIATKINDQGNSKLNIRCGSLFVVILLA